MDRGPVVIQAADLGWETWEIEDIPARGLVHWKTMVSADKTPSDSITMGLARVLPGERLRKHQHAQAEVYFILSGYGSVHVDGADCPVASRVAIFIPGNAAHGIMNTGTLPLEFIYAFATDSFQDVHYVFDSAE